MVIGRQSDRILIPARIPRFVFICHHTPTNRPFANVDCRHDCRLQFQPCIEDDQLISLLRFAEASIAIDAVEPTAFH